MIGVLHMNAGKSVSEKLIAALQCIVNALTIPGPFHQSPRSVPRTWSPYQLERMPNNRSEADAAYLRLDSCNGRYVLLADLVLEDGSYLRDVAFDYRCIAGAIAWRPIARIRKCFGKKITHFCTVTGHGDPVAREAFASNGRPTQPHSETACNLAGLSHEAPMRRAAAARPGDK
jgi:hypothetical protein